MTGGADLAVAAGWAATAATIAGAGMTAANLGTRVTGWGFVVFTFGSVAWLIDAVASGQGNLMVANGVLLGVNALGAWRWLGVQARFDKGGSRAAARSRRSGAPTLVPLGALLGARVDDRAGNKLGQVVDGMLRSAHGDIAYVVLDDGTVRRAVPTRALAFGHQRVTARIGRERFLQLPPINDEDWPVEPVTTGEDA